MATKRTFKNLEETIQSFGQQMANAIGPIAVSGSYAYRYAVEMESNYWMSLPENEPEFNVWNEQLSNDVEQFHAISEKSYVMAWDADRFGSGR